MTGLSLDFFEMPAGNLGPESPLPPLRPHHNPSSSAVKFDASVPAADRASFSYGGHASILPYAAQDDYDRARAPRSFRVAVLENDFLKATFLLELGGRLWSLYHKPAQRELLHVTPVFQPANLAIRNAWFCGGVEWNAAIFGHSPFTCAPVFAARVRHADGWPVLRLYEWDRRAGIAFQIDCFLPPGSPLLFVRVQLVNPHPHAIPMYWWSNISVPEQPGTRVLAPAAAVLRHTYDGTWRRVPLPLENGQDLTYPTQYRDAVDIYFYTQAGQRPWIAALDAEGTGLFQASTARLRGRKLFVWGMGAGGRRWQNFLSEPNHPYLEIQAGLARTQAEYLPMPAGACWSWLEAYGLMTANPKVVHGADWTAAHAEVEHRLDALLPQDRLEDERLKTESLAFREPDELLHRGSGWGALERRRREKAGAPPFCGQHLQFEDFTLGPAQEPWLCLLENRVLPCPDPGLRPASWMVQAEWQRLLEKSLRRRGGKNWLACLHLGLMQFHAGDFRSAGRSWKKSLALAPSAWALRNLAFLFHRQGRLSEAADFWKKALALQPQLPQLAVETCEALIAAGCAAEVPSLLSQLPEKVRNHGRLRYLAARAALRQDDLDQAESILGDLVVPDLCESETSLSDLWFELQEKRLAARENRPIDAELKKRARREYPPPERLDFRMTPSSP